MKQSLINELLSAEHTKKLIFICIFLALLTIFCVNWGRLSKSHQVKKMGPALSQRTSISSSSDQIEKKTTSRHIDPRLRDYEWSIDDCEEFLFEKNRGPNALALAFLITNNWKILSELKSHTSSRVVLQILASSSYLSAEERLYWSEQLHANNPRNGMGYLLMARAYGEMGDIPSFKEALTAAKNSPEVSGDIKSVKNELIEFTESLPQSKKIPLLLNKTMLINTASVDSISPDFLQKSLAHMSQKDSLEIVSSYLFIVESLRKNNSLSIITPIADYNTPESILLTKRTMILNSLAVHDLNLIKQIDPILLPEIPELSRDGYLAYHNLTPDKVDLIVEKILHDEIKDP